MKILNKIIESLHSKTNRDEQQDNIEVDDSRVVNAVDFYKKMDDKNESFMVNPYSAIYINDKYKTSGIKVKYNSPDNSENSVVIKKDGNVIKQYDNLPINAYQVMKDINDIL